MCYFTSCIEEGADDEDGAKALESIPSVRSSVHLLVGLIGLEVL